MIRILPKSGHGLLAAYRRSFAAAATGPLAGIRIVDLSRILAGPSATQMLADMGAEVIKVEAPKAGDDTRRYAPPFLQTEQGKDSDSEVAAYYASCNRNKYSVAVDFKKKEGQDVVKRLMETADVVIENFKAGGLAKYGLAYPDIKDRYPNIIYCSITGFGHTGPYSKRPAYDMLIQAMGGSMSLTGEPDGAPMKTGLSLFDLCAGLHGVIGILAALNNKHVTGLGQHVDISMLDVATSLLANQGMNYLAKKERQKRVGNNHPNVVPYQVMPASDGYFILTASNNDQFERFCKVAGRLDLMEDDRFNTMKARVVHRAHVTPALNEITKVSPKAWWLEKLQKEMVGCAPILHLDEVFADPQVQSRDMEIQMNLPGFKDPVSLIGSPMKFSRTKVDYRLPPPRVGEHTEQILTEYGFSGKEIADLHELGAIDNAKFEVASPKRPLAKKKRRLVSMDDDEGVGGNWDMLRSISVPVLADADDEKELRQMRTRVSSASN
jgi:crotonobetainyl-CoA:carnitine CoA-transferase CaiB-like acyl-CoA transferase